MHFSPVIPFRKAQRIFGRHNGPREAMIPANRVRCSPSNTPTIFLTCMRTHRLRRTFASAYSNQTLRVRYFSDNLLGHSPMASSAASPHIGVKLLDSKYIPTVQETIIGNVWQTSTSKRDKLLELKGELASLSLPDSGSKVPTLDDVATYRQKLDLWLVDGLRLIVKQVEAALPLSSICSSELTNENHSKIPLEVFGRINRIVSDVVGTEAADCQLQEVEWNRILSSAKQEIENALDSTEALQPHVLHSIRDFLDVADANSSLTQTPEFTAWLENYQQSRTEPSSSLQIDFANAVTRYQLLSALALVKQLQLSWNTLTSITDQDTDRAAVQQETISSEVALITTLSAKKLSDVIHAHLIGSCSTGKIDTLWNLIDKDNDGLIDQVEMNHVCSIALLSSQGAVRQLLQEAIDAAPLDRLVDIQADGFTAESTPNKESWRQKRRRVNDKKRLISLFQKTLNSHFDVELEMPHRLRCVYSWANKQHQDNKMDSVLVHEEGGGVVTSVVGRKRYVELHPKIALNEFREVQGIHFPQLDRIGQECLSSFRDELWVQQGKGRQNRELQRDCAIFFVAVCLLDFIVLSL
jgi:hypothetical protein